MMPVTRRQPESNLRRLLHKRRKPPGVQFLKSASLPGTSPPRYLQIHLRNSGDDIFRIFRKPSNIDPTGKDSEPADNSETTEEKTGSATAARAEPSKENRPTGSQSATGEAEAGNEPPTRNQSATAETSTNQEPPTGSQSSVDTENPEQPNKDIQETKGQASSPPLDDTNVGPDTSTFDKVEGSAQPLPKIITGNNLPSKFVFRKSSNVVSLLFV